MYNTNLEKCIYCDSENITTPKFKNVRARNSNESVDGNHFIQCMDCNNIFKPMCCDKCRKPFVEDNERDIHVQNSAQINFGFGWYSNGKDGHHGHVDFCQDCAEEFLSFFQEKYSFFELRNLMGYTKAEAEENYKKYLEEEKKYEAMDENEISGYDETV